MCIRDRVKTLNNKDYFEWLATRTGNVPNRWSVPLPGNAFENNTGKPIPKNFKKIYMRLRNMRSTIITPVDLIGGSSIPMTIGQKCGIPKDKIEPKNYRYQVLTSVMLSAQTKDEVTARGVENIMRYCIEELNISQGLTLEGILQIDEETLDQLIKQVGFHTRKAKFIKQTAQMLVDNFQSDVPTDIPGLLSLPGVGPKMAYLTLQKAWGRMAGICVDVHVHRFCRLFKWVNPKSKNPEETRKELESWLPHPLWREINSLLVGYGQIIDRARGKIPTDIIKKENDKPKKENKYLEFESLEQDFRKHMTDYEGWVRYLNAEANKIKDEEDIKAEAILDSSDISNIHSDITVKEEDNHLIPEDLATLEDIKMETDNSSIAVKKEES